MFLLFLITVHLNARIPEKLVFWTVSYTLCDVWISKFYLSHQFYFEHTAGFILILAPN